MATASSYECSLQGIVPTPKLRETLLQRLVGFCGKDSQMDLYEHEVGFTPAVQTPISPARNDDVLLRLRSKVTPESESDLNKRQWQLCLLGHPETRTRTVTTRPMTIVRINGDAFKFMTSLGYTFAFELVRKGYAFVYNDVVRITVTQLSKLKNQHDLTSSEHFLGPGHPDAWFVEATTAFVTQENVPQMAEQLVKFKGLLSGIVELELMDHRALQNKVQYT